MSHLTHSYDDEGAPVSGLTNVFWNAFALVGRNLIVILSAIVLARILGPDAYGIVAQATIYITLTTLLMDQGLASALTAKSTVSGRTAGAAASVNLMLALALACVTFLVSGAIASFFRTPELSSVLVVLGTALVFKGAAVVPRTLLMRRMRFKAIGLVEVGGALTGAVVGFIGAVSGWSYWALVAQMVATDLVVAVSMLAVSQGPVPNLALRALAGTMNFSVRVLFANLISFTSRNADNILIGRYLGAEQLGIYALAYRVLLAPIQMVGQVVTRVLFPSVARHRARNDLESIRVVFLRSTRGIACVTFPLMGLVAVSASDSVSLLLGTAWIAAVPILQILALTGARQSVTATNNPLLLGMGRADISLKFSIVAAVVQVAGMVAGLRWGIFGVAIGYTVAGILLTPVILVIQKRVVGLGFRSQLAAVLPAMNAAAWCVVPYLVANFLEINPILRLVVFSVVAAGLYLAILRLFHPETWTESVATPVAHLLNRRAS